MNSDSLLRTRRFLPLFLTQFLGAFNDNVLKNALVMLITYRVAEQQGMNAQILVTLAAGLFILPFFLFSAAAGQMADKHEKSKLVRRIKLAEILFMATAVAGFFLGSITILLCVLFLMGAQATFFGPLKYALLPEHLKEEELIAGNGLIEAGTFIAILTGTIAGGLLILTDNGAWLVSAALMLVAVGGYVSARYVPNAPAKCPNLYIGFNIFRDTWHIMRDVASQREVFLAITGISWFWLIGATFLSQFATYAKDVIGADAHVVTLFLTLFSLGVGAGSVWCNRLLHGRLHVTYVPLAALGMSVFILDLYFASRHFSPPPGALMGAAEFMSHPHNWRVMFDMFAVAVCGGLYIVPLYALMQAKAKSDHRARVIAGNNVMNALFMVIAAVATMLMLAVGFSVIHVFLVVALANLLVSVFICGVLPDVLLRSLVRGLLVFLYRVEIKGLEHFDEAGKRVVLVANHTSFLDALLLASFLPEKLMFAVNTHMARRWWLKPLLGFVDAFPLDPTNPMATKSLIDAIRKDKKCLIFPEGRITVTGSLMKIYEGPGMIADKSGAMLLPVRIDGAQYTPFSRLRGKVHIRWWPKITITLLPPMRFTVDDTLHGRARRQTIGNELYDIMAEMMFTSSNIRQTLFSALLSARKVHGGRHLIADDVERKPLSYNALITRALVLGRHIAKNTQAGGTVGVMLPNMASTLVLFFALQAFGRVPAMLNFSTGAANIVAACNIACITRIYSSRRFIETAKLHALVDQLRAQGIDVMYLEDVRRRIGPVARAWGWLMSHCAETYYLCVNQSILRHVQISRTLGSQGEARGVDTSSMSTPSPKDNDAYGKNEHALDADTPAVVLFTSGSEGTPKGVVLSHANIQANRYQISARVDFGPADIVFNALPMFHSFGLTGGTLLPVLSGISTFFYPSPLHYRIVPELVYDTNATILFGTDTFLWGYARYAHPYDFHSVRYVFAGAEKLKEETRRIWSEKFGVRIFEGYGATETAPVIAVGTAMHNRAGTVGRILPGIAARLQPVAGIVEGGQLWISGPNVMLGYLKADQPGVIQPPPSHSFMSSRGTVFATPSKWLHEVQNEPTKAKSVSTGSPIDPAQLLSSSQDDGPYPWYDTGDIVTIDAEGYIAIKGRTKRFAKIGGEMISLAAVEQSMHALWPDHTHAVINVPDDKKGEQLVLITTHPTPTREALVKHFRDAGATELSVPRTILQVEALPLLGTGKVDYVALKEWVRKKMNGELEL